MHLNWAEISEAELREGSNGGVRLLSLFAQDYFLKFNKRLNVGCGRCLRSALYEYNNLNSRKMAENTKTKYRLKPKYNGIMGMLDGKRQRITNTNLTDEAAIALYKRSGKQIFDVSLSHDAKAAAKAAEEAAAKAAEEAAAAKQTEKKKGK